MVGGGSGMSIFALDKEPLIASTPSLGDVFAFRGLPWEGAIQPVQTFGSCTGEYFVSRMSSTGLRVRQINDFPSNPVLTELCVIQIPNHQSPPDAPALGSVVPLDTVGHRLMNAVFRDGIIWTAHCIGLNGRAASRWYKINVAELSLDDYGTISDEVMYYFFPTIIVNAGGDVIMGFSGSHSEQYAAAYYTGRLSSDPSGEMASPVMLKEGEAIYNLIDGYGRNRWGDYSLCTLDPVKQTFWTIQEYAHSHDPEDQHRWGTWIGELSFNQPPEIPDTPSGPDEGVIGFEYTFTTQTIDVDDDDIYFLFDWGDGNDSGWLGPFYSGESVSDSYIWESVGEYSVKVKAKDENSESDWSEVHIINILGKPELEIGVINGGLFRVNTIIKNIGGSEATNVFWEIKLDGGAFIGKKTEGQIPSIDVGEEITIDSNFILGLGSTIITSKIFYGGGIVESRNQSGFVFLFFIKVNS
jgi:hypothetical protein